MAMPGLSKLVQSLFKSGEALERSLEALAKAGTRFSIHGLVLVSFKRDPMSYIPDLADEKALLQEAFF
ncbi:hypothetical protein FJ364_00155 [Candidatus Dependentiae bacterium]|nr:hypothetical protein [Candidatus Dependentiae bacterium]